jgi:hypothetical protein
MAVVIVMIQVATQAAVVATTKEEQCPTKEKPKMSYVENVASPVEFRWIQH